MQIISIPIFIVYLVVGVMPLVVWDWCNSDMTIKQSFNSNYNKWCK